MRRQLWILFTVVVFLAAARLDAQNDVGVMAFANSGAAAAQEPFLRGLALLHDFEYPSAAESFRKAQDIDPAFAMAYWGEAMTYNHPLWAQQDLSAARAALDRLAATPQERAAKAKTERERDYVRAVDVLYGTGTKEERDFKYADAMAALRSRYPDDVDGTGFYALSVLGTAHQGRDFAIYMRAAAVLEEVFPSHPQHPGILHYLIHSYDDPAHAPLGLRAARLYGKVAPNAGHALHMTSHIFLALGMWDEVVSANRQAIDVVNRQRAQKKLPPHDCGHYISWLHYALLQERQLDAAKSVIDACREQGLAAPAQAPAGGKDYQDLDAFAEMRLFDLVDGGHWNVADSAAIRQRSSPDAILDTAYGDALSALAAGNTDLKAAADATARLRAARTAALAEVDTKKITDAGSKARPDILAQQIEGLTLLRAGQSAAGLAVLRKAADQEGALPNAFGPPEIEKPSFELLAEELLRAGRNAEAAEAFRAALARAPGRRLALEGLLKAQQALGDRPAAAATRQVLDHCGHETTG